ncbi:MAG TPA: ABC transporter ATP-binding protein, partial [Magnetospirillaceae bacterium]|nr:ABC transporter ATP-binding protein [Magnetospirillaceae bacterium]
MALAERRPLCLLDEPTYVLDEAARAVLAVDLAKLAEGGTAVLFVSHDEDFIRRAADTVYRMGDGSLVREEAGSHADVLR